MKRDVGLWIDHRKAVVVIVTEEGEETKVIESDMEKHVRFASGSDEDGSAEDMRDRQFANHLTRYYDRVIELIGNAGSILILGPGEAKGELEKRLQGTEAGGRVVGVEAADKMTDRQIAARVRERFEKH
jgi:hypothetical protein